jgi:hypothetical protein
MSRREEFLSSAKARWGEAEAEILRQQLEKTADAVGIVESYPLEPGDEPAKEIKESKNS